MSAVAALRLSQASSVTRLETVADDLGWILEALAERTGATWTMAVRHTASGSACETLAEHGEVPSRELAQAVAEASREVGSFDRRRASDISANLAWRSAVHNALEWQALCFAMPADRYSRLVLVAAFSPSCRAERDEADAQGAYLYRMLAGYFRLWRRHRADSRRLGGMTAALDLSAVGIIMLDRAGEAIFVNRAAAALLAAGDGLRRTERSVGATDLASAVRLQVAVDHMLGLDGTEPVREAPIVALKRQDGKRPLIVAVLPLQPGLAEPDDPAVLLQVLDPAADIRHLLDPICRLHALSPVETRLVSELATGATLCEAAKALRIREPTARSYLKQIFVKTDTRRQADLVRLMLSSLVHMHEDLHPHVL